jgi:DNA-directed RNA polymerase subunit RPC12/RpoP
MSEKEQGVDNKIELGSNQEVVPSYVCNKCGNTISSNLGGYTVHYMDHSNPENGTIECDDCCPLSPNTLNWIARYEEEEAADAAAAAAEEVRRQEEDGYSSDDYGLDDYDPDYDPNNDHGFNCPCGSYDCRQFMTTTTGRNYPEYDHSEEAS